MTDKMIDLSFFNEHQSIPAKDLVEPAPSADELGRILQAAMSAPDHGEMRPFRFIVIQGDARQQLAKVFEQAARLRPHLDEAGVEKQKSKPLRSPLIVVVVARVMQNPKIPDIEQILSAGCAAQHIQLACSALGYGSVWLTGDNAYDIQVYEPLGLDINERVVGFIYIGTPQQSLPSKPRQDASSVTTHWLAPLEKEYAI